MKKMLSIKDAAEYLNVSESTVRRLILKDELHFKKIGGQLRIEEDTILLDVIRMQTPKEPEKTTRTRRRTSSFKPQPLRVVNGIPRYL